MKQAAGRTPTLSLNNEQWLVVWLHLHQQLAQRVAWCINISDALTTTLLILRDASDSGSALQMLLSAVRWWW
jgi:hypothetical protein